MAHPLRDRGTPRALAERRQSFDFKGDLSGFERLGEIVQADLQTLTSADRPARWRRSPVSVRLAFGFADLRETVPAVIGTASARLPAVCQRCLEPFELPLDVDFRYVLLPAGEQSDGLDGYEAWELTAELIRPLELVEEALIMALPLSAAHPSPELCGPLAGQLAESRTGAGDTVRPFAGLKAQLKETK